MEENKKEKLNNTSYKLDLDKLKQSVSNDAFASHEDIKLSNPNKALKKDIKESIEKTSKSVEHKKEIEKSKTTTKKSKKSKKRKSKKKKHTIILLALILVVLGVALFINYKISHDKKESQERQDELKQDIISHYNEYVTTNKETNLYTLNNSKYEKIGKVGKGEELTLEKKDITYEDEYLKITTFDTEYYIYYEDIDVSLIKPRKRDYSKSKGAN